MKKLLAILLISCMLMTTLASCDWFGGKDPEPECTEHVDANEDYLCDNCGAELERPQPPQCTEHKDEDGDLKCDVCGADVPAPPPPVCTEHKDENGDYKCDACEYVMFEEVKYTLNIGDLETGTFTADEINGKFTIVSGSEVRDRTKTFEGVEYTKSVKFGNATTKIKVSVPGTGKLSFLVQNGSSGAATQFITLIGPDGTVQDIEFDGTNGGNPVVKIERDVTEGEWIISRGKDGGTQDIFYLELQCVVAVAPESGFELVTAGKVDYLVGEELDLSKLQLNATYENGKTDTLDLSKVTVDTSKVDMSKVGTYDVTVSYKNYVPITYQVNVYANEGLKLDYDAIEKLAQNSSAGNGVYFNHSFKEVYAIGEELDKRGLSVTVISSGNKEFRVTDYTITGFDSTTAGAKALTISYGDLNATIYVYVVDTAIAEGNQVKVDKAYDGEIGAVVDGYNMFTTIQQALDYLARVPAAEQKLLVIGEGLYTEKLEITLPNLTIRGAGADKTTIEWDSIYGQVDAGGFTHTTDSTATVAVREQAINCVIEGVKISNYWNTQERLDEAGLAIERNLALLVQADRFIMKDSALLAIQDTLELFTGRQYFENVFISGYTDFIFGTNNTTYFKNCTIHVIDTGKDDSGTAGYITAFKGSNKGAADSIVYGAIFDDCKFTADEGVTEGKTAIGRTWGPYAAVAVINSELGGHISTAGYDPSENKNKRYISMNGTHPTDETVQFVEYNNTGDGAITEAVAGMRMLTAEEAALYADFAVIYGTINGNVQYLDPWDPMSDEVVVDDRTYYYFNGQTGTGGTSYTYDQNLNGTTGTFGEIAIDATAGKVSVRTSDTQMNAGAKLTFNVKGGTIVTVISYPGYGFYTLNGVSHNANDMFSQYYAEDTEVVMLVTNTSYIYQIIIDPNSEAPAAPELKEIKVEGLNLNYTVGDELGFAEAIVKAIYSDNSIVVIDDYTVDASAVVNTAAGTYDVVFTYGGKSVTLTVTYEDPNADPAITDSIVLDFTSVDAFNAVINNPRITLPADMSKFHNNGSNSRVEGTFTFMVKAGTKVTVIPYNGADYVCYSLGVEGEALQQITSTDAYTYVATKDCTIAYTGYAGTNGNYILSMSIECPVKDGKYVFGDSSEEGDVTGILASTNNITISGTCKTHSGGAQLGQDSEIKFTLPAFATLTVKGYDTSYGQLDITVNGTKLEMDANACYIYSTLEPVDIVIKALNVGTEEAPAYNKSYITYIDVVIMDVIDESIDVTFGSAGNYKDSGLDFSGIQIGDNGGNNSQIKNGSFSFAIKAGATVTINGYPGYTSYTLSDGLFTTEEITAEKYEYTAQENVIITITPVSGNNYFYSLHISYPAPKESVSITFGSEGNYKEGNDAIDLSGVQIGDNGGSNSQVKNGSITINLYAGATLKIYGFNGYTDYVLNDGTTEVTVNKDVAEHTEYVYTAEADVTVTITITSGNNYFYGIDIIY